MIHKSVNSFTTTVSINEQDFVGDDAKRFYAVPKDYRSVNNPHQDEPSLSDVDHLRSPYKDDLKEIMRIAQLLYWKVIADDAEYWQNSEGTVNGE